MKALLNVTLLGILFSFPVMTYGQGVGTGASFRGPVGLQTYSLRDQIAKEGAKAFDYVKEQGFKIVEIGLSPDSHYGMTPEDLRDTLKKHGIKPVAALTGLDYILNNIDAAVENARFFGVKYVGVAAFGHTPPLDEAQTLKIAEDFNTAGKLLKKHGIQFYYHNHGYEFQPYKGDLTLFDLLMEKTDPALVKFQMDVMWAVFPGQDPVKLLKKYPNRWISMHLKDLRKGVEGNLSGGTPPTNDVPIGTGQTDYPALLKAAQEVGIKHYFIEDESPDVLTQIPQSLKFLSTVKFSNDNRRLRGRRM
jgi:sugar phosphate isomerase/epimerase